MAGDDDDKTVFGQPLPIPPRPSDQPPQGQPPQPQPPRGTPFGDGDRTVFGQPLPPAGGAPKPVPPLQRPAPPPAGADPWRSPGVDDTWLGGALNPQPSPYPPQPAPPPHSPAAQAAWPMAPVPQPGYPPQSGPQPIYRPATGQRAVGSEFFPEIPHDAQRIDRAATPRIALSDALRAAGLGAGGSSNPLVAAAANLLILLGRLRTGLVEMQASPLIDHVTREIDLFERNALTAGVNPQDASDAKYALCATADDIVQNLPGADRGTWLEYSMVARFFGERSSGVRFFQKIDEAMRAPGARFHLLELMLTCLSLGFEGQYRALPNGAVELTRIRSAIYETLRRIRPRPDDDIAVKWAAVPMDGRRRRGAVPIWIVTAVAAAMVMVLFATLGTLLNAQTNQVRGGILALHQDRPPISIERTEPVIAAYVAPSTQLERIRAALAEKIAQGEVVVDRNNDWVYVRVGQYLQFAPASSDLQSDFAVLAAAIGATLNAEQGPVRVVGHTDSDPMSGRGRYKTNEQLSVARAQTVADILAVSLADPSRITVEGLGATYPIADNATREGKAQNRRVEIMIPRED
jgi:type VI secretion system protein ImpK